MGPTSIEGIGLLGRHPARVVEPGACPEAGDLLTISEKVVL
ncbi:MAG: hypothetical protein ACYCTL_03675 [Acidimicrobiales bacterium]